MEKVTLSTPDIITDIIIYYPIFSYFMLPMIRACRRMIGARNVPIIEDRMREEECQSQGRRLHQLAQGVNPQDALGPAGPLTPTWHIKPEQETVMIGRFLTPTFSLRPENVSRARQYYGFGSNFSALAFPGQSPYITENELPEDV